MLGELFQKNADALHSLNSSLYRTKEEPIFNRRGLVELGGWEGRATK